MVKYESLKKNITKTHGWSQDVEEYITGTTPKQYKAMTIKLQYIIGADI